MACNHKNKNCGCNDQALSLSPNFSNDPSVCPPDSEPCAEVISAGCVCWEGPDVCELDIKNGDRMEEVIQKVVLAIARLSCEGIEVTVPEPEIQSSFLVGITQMTGAPFEGTLLPDTPLTPGYINTINLSGTTETEGLFTIDRNNCHEDITITITSNDPLNPITFPGGLTTNTDGAQVFNVGVIDLNMDPGTPIGVYGGVLTFSAPVCGDINFNIEFNITA